MKKNNFSTIVSVFAVLLWGLSCSKSDPAPDPGTNNNETVISISAMKFNPDTVAVTTGTVVRWVNNDVTAHTATSDDGFSFDTGNIAAGTSATDTLNITGNYPYHCSIHPDMKGVIVVVRTQ